MADLDPPPLPVVDAGLRLLLCRWRRITAWAKHDLRAPFWRLYWNPTPGARIESGGERIRLEPDVRLLISPQTRFLPRHDRPFEHVFVHFTLGEGLRVAAGTIDRRPLSVTARRRLEALRQAVQGDALCPAPLALDLHRLVLDELAVLPATAWLPPVGDPRISAALNLLRASLAAPPANQELARACGLHPGHFVRLFTRQVGLPPHRWALLERLDRAIDDLQHGGLSVEAAAARWGFTDRQHLARALRRHRQVRPGELRRRRCEPRSGD